MSAPQDKQKFVEHWAKRCVDLLYDRNNLTHAEMEEVVQKLDKMKDERFKQLVASLIGWGSEERAELQTFCTIALEVMKDSPPSRLREAARRVELRHHIEKQGLRK
jgi:hypothetical protein